VLRLIVDATVPDPAALERAAVAIRAGELVALPTDTLYGLAADPFRPEAVSRLFAAKGRALDRAVPLIAADADQVVRQLGELSPLARRLAKRFWPGPLTLLVPAPAAMAKEVSAGTSRVGVRVPAHAVARGVCRASGSIVTASSANVSGREATADPDDVVASLGPRLDVLLDAGKAPGGLPSTIVDVTALEPRLVRPGAIPWEVVVACLEREE
jgi:L-threonylcarbamoyladenylate synthase